MNQRWKKRGTYGHILSRKIRKLERKFNEQIDSDVPDSELLFNYSKALDYSIQIQLSNISKIEEFDMAEIMDRYNERKKRIPKVFTANHTERILTT